MAGGGKNTRLERVSYKGVISSAGISMSYWQNLSDADIICDEDSCNRPLRRFLGKWTMAAAVVGLGSSSVSPMSTTKQRNIGSI